VEWFGLADRWFFFVGHMVAEKDVPALIKLFKKLYPEAFLSCPHAERKFILRKFILCFSDGRGRW
jgi:hypothetical protein